MPDITLTIPGEPVAKGRPRVTTWGTYTPEKTVNYETLIKEMFAIGGHEKLNGQLIMGVNAYFAIPKSASKRNRALMIACKIRPTKKPDFDNIGKIVGDALKGLAFDDDSQVVTGIVRKFYSETPRMVIAIREEIRGAEE